MDQLDGKVAVVTGAASGIGLAMARQFAAEGMRLVMADIEPGPLTAAADELRAGGAEVATQPTDVSDADQMDALRAATFDAFGAVHVVCNNAGVGGGGLIQDLTTADWQWVLGVNLWGVIHGMRVFLPELVAQDEGHIVNTASLAGMFAGPFMGPYNASKFAVVAITETAWHELRLTGSNVGVSALCPAWVRTRIHESARNRPAALTNAPSPAADERESMAAGLVESFVTNGMPPEEVAGKVVDAIRAKDVWILTHPESIEVVRARMQAIIDGGVPPMMGLA
jgi:NAD(P)-dependent dehydrogenase (short-subunit alcohol dehydrogenase family)